VKEQNETTNALAGWHDRFGRMEGAKSTAGDQASASLVRTVGVQEARVPVGH
jgi:hypothetical protein